jgi:hypothetical protein
METVTDSGYSVPPNIITFDYPMGRYIESIYKISSIYPAGDNSYGSNGVWQWGTGSCTVDAQLGELFARGGGSAAGSAGSWCGNTPTGFLWVSYGANSLPSGYNITQYHKYGNLTTHDGTGNTSITHCGYVDDIFQHGDYNGCSDYPPSGAQYDNRLWLLAWVGNEANPDRQTVDSIISIQSIRVWSCANWQTQSCAGAEKVNDGNGLIYWH